MNKLKNKKGITLVALIITIIVLIILAGITISIALGQNGIFRKSKKAVDEYQKAAQAEQSELDKTYVALEGKSLADQISAENYGDYVDYGIDINGDGNTKNDWKIFYKGKTNANKDRVFLIAADYIPTNNKELTEVMKNTDGKLAKSTNASYSDYCVSWKQDNLPDYTCYDGHNDLNKDSKENGRPCSFPDIFESTKYLCSEHTINENSRCASQLQCTHIWSPFATRDAEFAIGGPTLEMWIDSWNEKHGDNKEENDTKKLYCKAEESGTGYKVGTSDNPTSTMASGSSYYGSEETGYGDSLYFIKGKNDSHTNDLGDKDNDDINEFCSSYLLSSPSAYNSVGLYYVNYSGNINGGGYNGWYFGVRPVVCLRSGIYGEKFDEGENSYWVID